MRSTFKAALLIVLFAAASTKTVGAEEISVSVTSIEAGAFVRGRVSGIPAGKAQAYKVILYVHTDKWHIHPYEGQGEGKSWASIDDDGRWEIQTEQREFSANQLAVLVVKLDAPEVAKTGNLAAIPADARRIMKLTGTPNFGRL